MLDLLKVNLQLFADDDQEDVVGPQENNISDMDDFDDIGDVEDVEEVPFDDVDGDVDFDISEDEDVADPQSKKQSPEENAQYKKMRLKAEKDAREKLESERRKLEEMRLQIEQEEAEKKILNEYMNPEKVAELAYDEGVSEEVARRILRAETQKIIDAEKSKVKQRYQEVQEQKKALQSKKYFQYVEKDVDALVEQNPNVSYEMAYKFVVGDKIDELEGKVSKDVEKRTIANLHDRSRRRSIGSDSASSDPVNSMSQFGKEFASFMGVDPREASKVVQQRGRNNRNGRR